MIFPAKLCGYWALVTCSNPEFLGSSMTIDYNNFRFSIPLQKYGPFEVRKNIYGSIYLNNDTNAKILWSKTTHYTLESVFLPKIPIPWKSRCPRFNIQYTTKDDSNELTVIKANEKYVFRKHYVSIDNGDHIYKIFFTQLLFDLILKHLP
jgi:hypothetical protein